MGGLLKKLVWQDYALLVLFLVYVIFQINLVSQFQQMPSPLYGGDYYHQMGAVNHVIYGGAPFKSFTNELTTPNYSPIYGFLVGNMARVFNLNAMNAMFIFSFIVIFFSMLITYWFSNAVFKNKSLALISVLIFVRLAFFPILKYRELTLFILWPLFFLSVYKLLKTRKYMWALITGVIWGIGSLSHMAFFPMAIFFMPFMFIFMYYIDFVKIKKKKFKINISKLKKEWYKPLLLLLVVFFIGFIIAQVYWFQAIFVYHGQVPNPEPKLRHIDLGQASAIFGYFGTHFKNLFFHFKDGQSPWVWSLSSILITIGTISLFLIKKFKFRDHFLILIYASAFIIPLHFLLTVPIMGFHMDPYLMQLFFYRILSMLIVPFAILVIMEVFSKFEFTKYIPYLLIGILLIFNVLDFNYRVENYKWYQTGKSPLAPYLIDASTWLTRYTGIEDMFIAPKEIGSAVNGISGRKFLAVRGNQESLISPVFERQGDLAVILYGNNTDTQKTLLKKYNVKYLYWDYYWLRAEFQFDKGGALVGYFDPLYVRDTPENRQYFKENGVAYTPENMAIDPSSRNNPLVPKLDMLVAYPPQFDMGHPWSYSLDKFLIEIQSFSQDNQVLAKVYEVRI